MRTISGKQVSAISRIFTDSEIPFDQAQKLISSGLLADLRDGNIDQIDRSQFRKLCGLDPLELKITVDYSQDLETMIVAGNYDYRNSDITAQRFPISGKGRQELTAQIIHFNRDISSDDAEKELDKIGLRPATSTELLAFGATFPEMQRKFPIVALGSVAKVGRDRYVMYLAWDDSERDLRLSYRDGGWSARYRFLAFAK